MKTMSARQAKNEFGAFIDAAQREPVIVTKHDRPVAALISMQALESLATKPAEGKNNPAAPYGGASLSAYIGSLRGVFGTPAEIDEYIRKERESW